MGNSDFYGIIKPKGPTSHDIIDKIRKITGIERVGHAGTLDPLASGILVVAVGREATKKISEAVKKEKEYLALVKLGEESSTGDAEGKFVKIFKDGGALPELGQIKDAISKFQGEIKQVPPVHSAVKIKGKKAYQLARRGEIPDLKAREAEIKNIEVLEYKWPVLKLKILTGPGVYIRALARDLGRELGIGAYLAELERTRVGDFTKKNSMTLAEFEKFWKKSK